MSIKFSVPSTGPGPISFRRLMAIKQTEPDTFESTTPAWSPTSQLGVRTFGGHVYAQTIYAASKTVPQSAVVHSITGHFILPGLIDRPFVYKVRRIRDGNVYFLRGVDVFQNPTASTPCFVATLSFKIEEQMDKWIEYGHQNAGKNHVRKEYAGVLDGIEIAEHPLVPGADAKWWTDRATKVWLENAKRFPGLDMRKVDMTGYNGKATQGGGKDGEGATKWRQLLFYRLIMDHEDNGEVDLNLHAAAHCYASDRNSLFLIPRAFGYESRVCPMASLSHTVIFHGPMQNLRLTSEDGTPVWFVQESWTSHTGANRGCHESRMWNYERGIIAATSVQDGMIRVPKDEQQQKGTGRASSHTKL